MAGIGSARFAALAALLSACALLAGAALGCAAGTSAPAVRPAPLAEVRDSPSRVLVEVEATCLSCGIVCRGHGGAVCRNEGCPMYGLPQRGRRW